jgi:MtrB/PioB family decaheme-associated outer membrane protein
MKRRGKFLLTCVAGMMAVGPLSPAARAADQAAVKADPTVKADPIPFWWFHGELDVGGRFFVNNPQRDGLNYLRQDSLAKYYEYRTIKPGPFSNIWLSTGSRDGLYQVDIGGKNIGYSDQYYWLDASKAGEHYFNFQWDQTPHLYSTSARTIYDGVGTSHLTVPSAVSTALSAALAVANFNGPGGVQSIINSNVHQTDIGIRRDTASVEYRWTPTDAWDIKADYSHLHRQGSQAMGTNFNNSFGTNAEAPAPVNDSTQNFGLNGEYAGTTPWDKKFNVKLAYSGSIYRGDSSFDIDNPFPTTGAAFGRMSLWPDNNANAFTATMGADLPGKSRYMGTTSYTMMRQNDAYLPFTSNGLLGPINGQPATSTAALPFSSLNGSVNTILSNNVVTTQITPELKSKLAYRYYDYDNGTPTQFFGTYVQNDAFINNFEPKLAIPVSYTKQNGLAELIWTPLRGLTAGAQYGYERYAWSWNDADHTAENSGKLYSVYKLNSWLTARGSWQYAERRYGTYTNAVQLSSRGHWNEHYRSPELANRNQNIGKFQVDVVVVPTIIVSPFAGFLLQDYLTDALGPAREVGILKNNSWNVGAELIWAPNRRTQLMVSYTYDQARKRIVGGGGTTGLATSTWDSNIDDNTNTVTAALKQVLIDDKLDLKLSYVYSLSNGAWTTVPFFYNGYVPNPDPNLPPNPNYPDTKITFQRLDAILTYKMDPGFVRQMGWTGDALIRGRYAWERNSVNDWQIDNMQPYMFLPPFTNNTQTMVWLAGNNPNYNVHLLGAALILRW